MRSLASAAAVLSIALALSASCAQSGPLALTVRADNGASPFKGDGAALVTVSPNGDGFREAAVIHYRLAADSLVRFDVVRHGAVARSLDSAQRVSAGDHVYRFTPPARPVPAAYLIHVVAGGVSAK